MGARDKVDELLNRLQITRHFRPGKIYQKRIDALLHAQQLLAEGKGLYHAPDITSGSMSL